MMDRQLAHLVRLVDDLIDVSRITRGTIALRMAPRGARLDHSPFGRGQPAAGEASRHRVDVTLPSEPIHVHADATRLSQVFINILNNACKYTGTGWPHRPHGRARRW